MVIDGHGGVAVLGDVTADLLLGIDPTTERHESEITLDRGATLLLYTDGLVERRGQNLDEGLARLRALLLELADRPLAELCDELLTRLLPARAEDDVALVAVRLHPQDEPRPAEAGPQRVPPEVPDEVPDDAPDEVPSDQPG
jgi:serine/threonine protein phosphatase PrpC